MLTGRRVFQAAIETELGNNGLTQTQRFNEAMYARRMRNVFFSVPAPVITNSVPNTNIQLSAQSLAYGMPIIITDILNYCGFDVNGTYWEAPNFLAQLFTTNDAALDDFFGVGGLLPTTQLLTHMRNTFTPAPLASHPVLNDIDSPSNKIHFAPYLLKPGQVFLVKWNVPSANTASDINCELDFRGVVVLDKGDQYGALCGRLKEQVCAYISNRSIETFISDLIVDPAKFSGPGQTVTFVTEPQQRPLLIYGITTNLNGVSVRLRDQATRWEFCLPGPAPVTAINGGAPVTYQGPTYQGVPLYVLAANPEITNRDAYYYFPVPHLLEPNTSMVFKLTNGLRPNAVANTFQQTINTVGLFNDGGGQGKISMLCRTV